MPHKTYVLPATQSPRPKTNPIMPHLQLSDIAGPEIYPAPADWLLSLEQVAEPPAQISISSMRAVWLLEPQDHTRPGIQREFKYIHAGPRPNHN